MFGRTLLALLITAAPAVAQDRTAIETTIENQLSAFVARDIEQAFEYASPSIQRLFDSPDIFGHMVEHGYPMVWDNADTEFLSLRNEAGRWVQRVLVTDGDGDIHVIEYMMVETANGWLIDGVMLSPEDPTGEA